MSKANGNSENKSENNERNKGNKIILWPLVTGLVILGFGILLLTLRVIVPSFVLALTGIALLIYWMYLTKKNAGIRSGQRDENLCACAICDHAQIGICIKQKCVCCSIAKGDKIVGHTNNPLQ